MKCTASVLFCPLSTERDTTNFFSQLRMVSSLDPSNTQLCVQVGEKGDEGKVKVSLSVLLYVYKIDIRCL